MTARWRSSKRDFIELSLERSCLQFPELSPGQGHPVLQCQACVILNVSLTPGRRSWRLSESVLQQHSPGRVRRFQCPSVPIQRIGQKASSSVSKLTLLPERERQRMPMLPEVYYRCPHGGPVRTISGRTGQYGDRARARRDPLTQVCLVGFHAPREPRCSFFLWPQA